MDGGEARRGGAALRDNPLELISSRPNLDSNKKALTKTKPHRSNSYHRYRYQSLFSRYTRRSGCPWGAPAWWGWRSLKCLRR